MQSIRWAQLRPLPLCVCANAFLLAAPALARTPAAAPAGEAPSLLPMLLALGFVLALIPLSMWLLKRMGGAQPREAAGLRVVTQLALGPRERLVVVEAGQRWLVLGVTAASINRVGTLPKGETPPPPASTGTSFANLLNAARGRTDAR